MQKELRSGIINFWLVVYGLSQFLARGHSCRKIFGSRWLAVARGRSWWLVVGRGGLWWLLCCFRFDQFWQHIKGLKKIKSIQLLEETL